MLEFCPTPGTFKYKKIIIFNLKAILYIPQTSYNNQMEKKTRKETSKKSLEISRYREGRK